jgi:DNA-binding NtrC family response regulator
MRPVRPLRIVASSSARLFDRVVDQLFSERLYYRLNVIHVVVPPSRLIAEETVG